jgi:hypothetical protein
MDAEKGDGGSTAWFLAGAAVGAVLGFLFAPRPGEDTRKLLQKTTRYDRDATESSGKEMIDRGRELYERGRKIIEEAEGLFGHEGYGVSDTHPPPPPLKR